MQWYKISQKPLWEVSEQQELCLHVRWKNNLEKKPDLDTGAAEYVLPCTRRDELACAHLKAEWCAGRQPLFACSSRWRASVCGSSVSERTRPGAGAGAAPRRGSVSGAERGEWPDQPAAGNLQMNATFSSAIRKRGISGVWRARVTRSRPVCASSCAGKRPGFVCSRHQMGSNYECDKRVIWQTLCGPAAA